MALNPASPNLGTGPTNQQGPFPQPGSTTPTTQVIGPLPASTMPGQLAQTIPVMANFQFLLAALNQLQSQLGNVQNTVNNIGQPGGVNITGLDPIFVQPGPITSAGSVGITTMGPSGPAHDRGAVPDPGNIAGITKFLREDATWQVPPGGGGGAGGFLKGQEFTAVGAFTFNVPVGVTSVWVTMIGAGGAGGGQTSNPTFGGGGGGAGELVQELPMIVTSGGTVSGSIGAGGTGVSGATGNPGGTTSFGLFNALGGQGGIQRTSGGASGGAGGGPGNSGNAVSGSSNGLLGKAESNVHFAGGGGGGASSGGPTGGFGAPAGGYLIGATGGSVVVGQDGGGGGATTIYGLGGIGGNGGSNGISAAATSYGAGGGGSGGISAGNVTGGNGAPGYCLVQWVG